MSEGAREDPAAPADHVVTEHPSINRPWTAWFPLLTLGLFLCGSLLAMLPVWPFDRFDYCAIQGDGFMALNRLLNRWPAGLWWNLTQLGDAAVLIPLLSPLVLWRPQAWAAALAAAPVASVFSVTIKHLAAVPRPAAYLNPDQFVVIGRTLKAKNSFPSGHSLTIFTAVIAVLMTLYLFERSWRLGALTLIALAMACAVAVSRVAVGAHWPLDVLGGGLLGILSGIVGAALAARYPRGWRLQPGSMPRCLVGIILMLMSLSLCYQAFDEPELAITLGLSGLCGLLATGWLLQGCRSRWLPGLEGRNRSVVP
jgi:membrane-associated phospholipid phosphatase